jgi:hypothetical protein
MFRLRLFVVFWHCFDFVSLFFLFPPPSKGRVLLRLPKLHRKLAGGQPELRGFEQRQNEQQQNEFIVKMVKVSTITTLRVVVIVDRYRRVLSYTVSCT